MSSDRNGIAFVSQQAICSNTIMNDSAILLKIVCEYILIRLGLKIVAERLFILRHIIANIHNLF